MSQSEVVIPSQQPLRNPRSPFLHSERHLDLPIRPCLALSLNLVMLYQRLIQAVSVALLGVAHVVADPSTLGTFSAPRYPTCITDSVGRLASRFRPSHLLVFSGWLLGYRWSACGRSDMEMHAATYIGSRCNPAAHAYTHSPTLILILNYPLYRTLPYRVGETFINSPAGHSPSRRKRWALSMGQADRRSREPA